MCVNVLLSATKNKKIKGCKSGKIKEFLTAVFMKKKMKHYKREKDIAWLWYTFFSSSVHNIHSDSHHHE